MVQVQHMVGPMWSVGGRPVVVPPGSSAPAVLLAHVAAQVTAPGPWPVTVIDGENVLELVLGADGSVAAAPSGSAAAGKWWRR